jgi:hypothetical protein
MAAPAYSTRFYAVSTLSDEEIVVGPVPDGYIWVLRDLDVHFPEVVEIQNFNLKGSAAQVIVSFSSITLQGGSNQWHGRQILFAGETFALTVSGADGADVTISGYVLVAGPEAP